MAFTTKCHCHRQERVAGTLYIFNFDESRRRRRMPGFQENNWHPNCFKIKAGDSNPKEKLSIIRERARERRRQIKAMLSNRPACCFVCVCVCVDSLWAERKQFLKDTGGEKEKKAFSTFRRLGAMALRLSSVVSPERQAAVDVYNRRSFGCKSPLLTQSHSINCFRAKLQVSLWNFLKNLKGGRAGSRSDTRGKKAAYRRRGQHKAKAFHI